MNGYTSTPDIQAISGLQLPVRTSCWGHFRCSRYLYTLIMTDKTKAWMESAKSSRNRSHSIAVLNDQRLNNPLKDLQIL